MIGRLTGTYLAQKIPPWLYIVIDCVGSIAGISFILGVDGNPLGAETDKAILYTGVVIFGYFVSCVYGCATNLCNGYTNMGNSIIISI